MAAVSLNSNLAALRGERSLNASSAELSSTLERLSSGKRINHASDDAAGIAVSSTLNANARVFTQATRNVNDGISFLNIADGATGALKSILTRMRELSTQASNGTYSSTQRRSLDTESRALQKEYNRIIQSTNFNGVRVFNGAQSNVTLQAGYGSDGVLTANIAVNTCGDGTFAAGQSFNSGVDPSTVPGADLNGDGKTDLMSVDYGSGTFSVFIGNGDGTFQARRSFDPGAVPFSAALSDVDGDSRTDLISVDFGAGMLSVLRGNGDGTFTARQSFVSGTHPTSVSLGDFNADNKTDLVSTNYDDKTISVLLGNGDGTFAARRSFTTGTGPASTSVADVNGDGETDIVSIDEGGTFDVFLGNGNGTFRARLFFASSGIPQSVSITDFNDDGKRDLISADWLSNTLTVVLGNGDGTFGSKSDITSGAQVRGVRVGDFNADGKEDFVSSDYGSNTLSVFLGNGDGTFAARQSFATGTGPTTPSLIDVNGDEVTDLVSGDYGSGTISVFLGHSTKTSLNTIGGISLATREDALTAQGQIDSLFQKVNNVSGAIGGSMSRLEVAARTTNSMADTSKAAESRITDADVADNTAALTRDHILQQAGAAVLAQANQQPALALTLLH